MHVSRGNTTTGGYHGQLRFREHVGGLLTAYRHDWERKVVLATLS